MRIIAGKWRGRRLAALKGDRVRPTADRVKEAMFSILGPQLPGATFLDLCCGTGGLGLEALSRGAVRVFFVDESRHSLDQVRRNLEILGVSGDTASVHLGDAVQWFRQWPGSVGDEGWLVVADPPYLHTTARDILERVLDRAGEAGFRGAVVEHDPKNVLVQPRDAGPQIESRTYGSCGLTIVRPD
jgi:16S rRNA (guanine966-N2)-methyltransferase